MTKQKRTVKVVAAAIENENKEILCALRSPRMSLPNVWEFPGGKAEEGEDIFQALQRGIKEELQRMGSASQERENTKALEDNKGWTLKPFLWSK